MNKKTSRHIQSLVYVILSIIFVVSCQEYENDTNKMDAKQFKNSKLTMYNFEKTDSIFKAKPFLSKQINEKFAKKDNYSRLASLEYGFSIDTTNVQVIQGENFESFTFVVERPTYNSSVLENYVLTVGQNGTYTQMLVSYPILSNEAPRENKFDLSNINVTFIEDTSILYRGECPNSVPEIVEWSDNENCVAHNCGLPGNHSPGEACGDGEYRAYWECTGAWVVTGCVTFSGGSGNDGTGSQTGGGTGGSENTDPTDTEIPEDENGYIGIPISPLEIVLNQLTPCEKLKRLMDVDKVNIKDDLVDLAQLVNVSASEYAYVYSKDSIGNYSSQYLEPNANMARNSVNITAGGDRFAAVHIHTVNLYSMFTFADVWTLYNLYYHTNQENREEVAFLLVANEELNGPAINYALIIDDFSKFRNKIQNDLNVDPRLSGLNLKQKLDILEEEMSVLFVNSDNLEETFLKRFKDSGISMYKTNSNIDNWVKLTLSSNDPLINLPTIIEEPCVN